MGASASSSHSGVPITMHYDPGTAASNPGQNVRSSSHRPISSTSVGVGNSGIRSSTGSGAPVPQSTIEGNSDGPTSHNGTAARAGGSPGGRTSGAHLLLNRPEPIEGRQQTFALSYSTTTGASGSRSARLSSQPSTGGTAEGGFVPLAEDGSKGQAMFAPNSGGDGELEGPVMPVASNGLCLNPASDLNSRLDTQVEIKVYPCNNSSHGNNGGRKKCTQFIVKPEGVIIQGTNRPPSQDIGTEYSRHIGRKLPRYELSDTRASQLLITSHHKNYYVIPAPEAFSRHSGTCRLLGDRKHNPCSHTLKVGDFLRVGSVGVVVIETHNGVQQESMSEERIQRIMQDTTVGGYVDAEETDLEDNSDVETAGAFLSRHAASLPTLPSPTKSGQEYDVPTCYMCFDDEDTEENPLISPCKCKGDTQFVHVDCLRKWHTAEADNQICFLSTVDATCSVCKSTFKSDFRLKSGHLVKLFQSSLEAPYVSLLIATKHEMAQRLFNTRFQLSFKTLMKPDGKNATRPLLLGRSSGSDMVLDYRTVSARHATIKFKNGEFIFGDAGSSNGSYLYVRQPVELCPNAPSVQFRLGRSMISMKVVNKWNRRLLRAVTRRSGGHTPTFPLLSQGGNSSTNSDAGDYNPHVNDGVYNSGEKKTRETILKSMPSLGMLDQQSALHLDLIYALAIPKRELIAKQRDRASSTEADRFEGAVVQEESKEQADLNFIEDEPLPLSPSSPRAVAESSSSYASVHEEEYVDTQRSPSSNVLNHDEGDKEQYEEANSVSSHVVIEDHQEEGDLVNEVSDSEEYEGDEGDHLIARSHSYVSAAASSPDLDLEADQESVSGGDEEELSTEEEGLAAPLSENANQSFSNID